jgi:hypothetical protein
MVVDRKLLSIVGVATRRGEQGLPRDMARHHAQLLST